MEFKKEREIEEMIDHELEENALRIAKERHSTLHKGQDFSLEIVEESGLPTKMEGRSVKDAEPSEEQQESKKADHHIKHSKGWVCCTQCGWHQSVDQVLGYGLEVGDKRSNSNYAGEIEEKEGYTGRGGSQSNYQGNNQSKY